jgi:alanyl-tRNA synthetase
VEAVTGRAALDAVTREHQVIGELSETLSAPAEQIPERVAALQAEIKQLKKQLQEARKVQSGGAVGDMIGEARDLDGVKLVVQRVDLSDRDALVQMGDALREKLRTGVAVLGGEIDGKVAFLAVVTDDLIKERGLKAGDVIKQVAAVAGGSGGGRPHLAQAGGKDPAKIDAALEAAEGIVRGLLG